MQPVRLIDPFVRAFRWHRRWFAAILASIAVLATLSALSPEASGTVPVVVAGHEIAGGSTLTSSDLQVITYPAEAVPEGSFRAASDLAGAEVVGTVPARRPLTSADLLDGNSLVAAGKVAVPVRFSDADSVAILSVGRHIDILGQPASDAAMTTVAGNVRVVAIPGADRGGVLGAAGGGLVLVEADQAQSVAILTATSAGTLGYVLR